MASLIYTERGEGGGGYFFHPQLRANHIEQ